MNKKTIDKEDWSDRVQSFVSGNLKKKSKLTVNGAMIASNAELLAMDYDPLGKGNDFVISLEGCSHVIDSPDQFNIYQRDNGEVSAVEIIDKNGASHSLLLE